MGQRSIAVAYNQILDWARRWGVDALVLLHDDLEVTDPLAEEKALAALADDVAIVGVAGGGPCMWWWNHDPIGHQTTDSRHLEFGGRRTGDVSIVEGSYMVFSPWAIENLRFDETYEFLGYDDVCLHALEAGKRVIVADIDTHHHTTLGFKSPQVEAMWNRAAVRFRQKWNPTCGC